VTILKYLARRQRAVHVRRHAPTPALRPRLPPCPLARPHHRRPGEPRGDWCGARDGGATLATAAAMGEVLAPVRRGLTLDGRRARREEILRIAYPMVQGNVRDFGSMVRGEADYTGDINLLVDVVADADGDAYFAYLRISDAHEPVHSAQMSMLQSTQRTSGCDLFGCDMIRTNRDQTQEAAVSAGSLCPDCRSGARAGCLDRRARGCNCGPRGYLPPWRRTRHRQDATGGETGRRH
jgi:predicted nucleotidyltransferase